MPQFTEQAQTLQAWADLLVCPACHGALRLDAEGVRCAGCNRVFPVVDGIPVLIAERGAPAANPA